jgi:hypothetical protein
MKRYDNISTTTRWDGKRVYNSVKYPIINPSETDIQIVTNETDFLDTLAYKYYGDPTLYWIIARANKLGKGRLSVQGGLILRVPININEIVNKFNELNSK